MNKKQEILDALITKLKKWYGKNVSNSEFFEWYGDWYGHDYDELLEEELDYEEGSEFSFINNIVGELDLIDINLHTHEDAAMYIEFFDNLKIMDAKKAYEIFEMRKKEIDYQKKKEELKNDPFYAPYCKF